MHAADQDFVFVTLLERRVASGQDWEFAHQLVIYWTNFAKMSNLKNSALPFWPTYGNDGLNIMELGNVIESFQVSA
ncbi:hypothetical protein V502_01671 [Pseudogymnoascus sp. VKM F-4520 (FW-2644)]|nr:hypothetical protein V502_01671 [Pseudogymnoascus sp. VKM F-4520 (FW-2644)]